MGEGKAMASAGTPTPACFSLFATLLVVCMPGAARAVTPDVHLADLHSTQWTREQGAPADVSALAQSADGMLWIEAANGLYRFDGRRFEAVQPIDGLSLPRGKTVAMQPDLESGLWVAYGNGGVVLLRNDSATPAPGIDIDAADPLRVLAVGADRRLWAATRTRLLTLAPGAGAWQALEPGLGGVGAQIDDVERGPDGRIWVLTDAGVFVGAADASGFTQVEALQAGSATAGLAVGADGEVWRWNLLGEDNLCRVMPLERRGCWKANGVRGLRIDAHGALWWTALHGILRVSSPDRLGPDRGDVERLAETIPERSRTLIIGLDGSIWSTSTDGLLRLRQTPVRRMRTPTGAIVAAGDGELWLASFSRGLMRIGTTSAGAQLHLGDDDTLWTEAARLASAGIDDTMRFEPYTDAVAPDTAVVIARYPEAGRGAVRLDALEAGSVHMGTFSPVRILRHDGDSLSELALPPLDRGAVLRGLQRDASGDLWLGVQSSAGALYRLHDGTWIPNGGVPGVEPSRVNGLAVVDDALWILLGEDAVGRIREGVWTRFGAQDGLNLGQAIGLHVRDGQLWVSGLLGLAAFDGQRFVPITGVGDDRFIAASGLLQLENGDLWINGVEGISRIERGEWQRAISTPEYRVAFTRFDHHDGLTAGAMQGGPLPSIARDSLGRLWFATTSTLVRLDPADVPAALPPPVVEIRRFSADDTPIAPGQKAELPVGTTRIGIQFAAPPIEYPERVRFRYRLAGGDWLDAGDRREVQYESLAPGDHLFEVASSDRDGRWSETPTRLGFRIPPAFHQTTAFRALISLLIAALLAALYAIRMRQVSERTRRETTARLQERMRISRDLHDTLLQSVQALHLQMEAIATRVPEGDPLRQRIDHVLDRAHDTLCEGRDRISALREPLSGSGDLTDCLQRIAERLTHDADLQFELQADTPPRPLQPEVNDELLHIGREALTNACQHAQACRVTLRVAHADDALTIAVIDDGIGFPADVLQQGGRDGHLGLHSMRERAALAGAELKLRNLPEAGAEVRIRVPAQRAYLQQPRAGMLAWLRRVRRHNAGAG
jgi:signal transduction histidine kinase/ligand-binding sensor domain-containing protein